MNSIRKLLAGLLAAGALLTAGAGIEMASAADDSMPPPGAHGWYQHGPMHLYEKLGLNDAQKAQIKTIMQSAHPQLQSIHQQMRDNTLKLHQTQPNDPNYAQVVSEVSQANAALHAQLTTQMAGVRQEIFTKVLTPAQQTQLQQLEAQAPTHMHGHPADT
jgi:Spy/CpxP family protein refolding chaperone